MSWKIQIIRTKPNPSGKDKVRGIPQAEQLLGEWVDLKNTGDAEVSLGCLHLAHTAFNSQGIPEPEPRIYWNGYSADSLNPGELVRIHTGKKADSVFMKYEDALGVDLHSFAEKGSFVLNNACGDKLTVWWQDKNAKWYKEDEASYDRNPPEGVILVREGNKLVVPRPVSPTPTNPFLR